MKGQEKRRTGGLDALLPVGRETAQDRVYGQLRSALIHGAFDAGELFLVGEVANRMSVSSMPVREALARLVSEHALEAMPNRRVRVPLLTQNRARDIASARALIEGELAARALPNLNSADLSRLEELTGQYEAAPDESSVVQLNHAFHFHIYHCARSPVLLSFAESLWMQAGPFVREAARLHSPLTDQQATHYHHGILTAIRESNVAGMVDGLNADINQAFEILERAGSHTWDARGMAL